MCLNSLEQFDLEPDKDGNITAYKVVCSHNRDRLQSLCGNLHNDKDDTLFLGRNVNENRPDLRSGDAKYVGGFHLYLDRKVQDPSSTYKGRPVEESWRWAALLKCKVPLEAITARGLDWGNRVVVAQEFTAVSIARWNRKITRAERKLIRKNSTQKRGRKA